ncbi:thermonuclease family protein [Paracoccus limosus]|nr:thermonuclease family protein [Paracoccus limosus]
MRRLFPVLALCLALPAFANEPVEAFPAGRQMRICWLRGNGCSTWPNLKKSSCTPPAARCAAVAKPAVTAASVGTSNAARALAAPVMAERRTRHGRNREVAGVIRALVLGAAMVAPAAAYAASEDGTLIVGRAVVVDGDTIKIGSIAIRIHGIDATEQSQTCSTRSGQQWNCGEAATGAMADLVRNQVVECVPLDTDAYRRIVARCHAGGLDLGAEMVGRGLAWAYHRYSDAYAGAERVAHAGNKGIWRGKSQPAWDYRANRWTRAIAEAPKGCPIKGNISNKGERIYHTPWSPAYAKTRIDENKGERWFCDEAAAIAAGWRAARWR